jgi:hypothetical protein
MAQRSNAAQNFLSLGRVLLGREQPLLPEQAQLLQPLGVRTAVHESSRTSRTALPRRRGAMDMPCAAERRAR